LLRSSRASEFPDGGFKRVEPVIDLVNWSFDSQFIYSSPTVRAGDSLRIACTYENPGDTFVVGGLLTTDEMCFNFSYVTPPEGAGNPDCSPQLSGAIDVEVTGDDGGSDVEVTSSEDGGVSVEVP
jgi:hypothetical protein